MTNFTFYMRRVASAHKITEFIATQSKTLSQMNTSSSYGDDKLWYFRRKREREKRSRDASRFRLVGKQIHNFPASIRATSSWWNGRGARSAARRDKKKDETKSLTSSGAHRDRCDAICRRPVALCGHFSESTNGALHRENYHNYFSIGAATAQ